MRMVQCGDRVNIVNFNMSARWVSQIVIRLGVIEGTMQCVACRERGRGGTITNFRSECILFYDPIFVDV